MAIRHLVRGTSANGACAALGRISSAGRFNFGKRYALFFQTMRRASVGQTTMKLRFQVAGTILLCAAASGRAAEFGTAGYLADICQSWQHGIVDSQDAAVCALTLGAFADGFRDGSLRGLRTALSHAPQDLATTRAEHNLKQRILTLLPTAQCFPPTMTVEQLGDVFVRFIRANPSRRAEYYRAPLVEAAEASLCP